jgi:hypothetical protein
VLPVSHHFRDYRWLRSSFLGAGVAILILDFWDAILDLFACATLGGGGGGAHVAVAIIFTLVVFKKKIFRGRNSPTWMREVNACASIQDYQTRWGKYGTSQAGVTRYVFRTFRTFWAAKLINFVFACEPR